MTRFSAAIRPLLRRFAQDERGATAVEYCLIATGIAGAIIAAVTGLGGKVLDMWTGVAEKVASDS
jgi:pilus assembly protein Flp/PilA